MDLAPPIAQYGPTTIELGVILFSALNLMDSILVLVYAIMRDNRIFLTLSVTLLDVTYV